MGDVHAGTADLGLTTIGITAERFQHFDIFYSNIGRSYSVVIHEDNLLTVQTTSRMMNVFSMLASYDVWVTAFLMITMFLVLGVTFDRLQVSHSIPRVSLVQSFADWGLRTVGTGLGRQGIGTRCLTWPSNITSLYVTFSFRGLRNKRCKVDFPSCVKNQFSHHLADIYSAGCVYIDQSTICHIYLWILRTITIPFSQRTTELQFQCLQYKHTDQSLKCN